METSSKTTAVDQFIEEYGDKWTLEMVRSSHDDCGETLEIFVDESQADELRAKCPPKFRSTWTVVIGVPVGWGANFVQGEGVSA